MFALENKQAPGYVTEKIVNAFYSGAIPIYWGSSTITELFNKTTFINVSDFNSLRDCVDYVMALTDKEIKHMNSQEYINKNNDIINIYNSISQNKYLNKISLRFKNKILNKLTLNVK